MKSMQRWLAGERPPWSAKIVVSHWVTRLGTQAWALALPLALLAASSSASDSGNGSGAGDSVAQVSVQGAALYMFARYGAKTLLAPSLGSWADNTSNRLRVVQLSVLAQVLSIGSVTLVATLGTLASIGGGYGEQLSWPGSNFCDWFVVVACVTGAVEVLGATTVSVAVSKEWLPTLAMSEAIPDSQGARRSAEESIQARNKLLASVNADMSRADLFSEVIAPIASGFAISLGGEGNELKVLALVGLCNLLSYVPEYLLLAQVYESSESLQRSRQTENREKSTELPQQQLMKGLTRWVEPTRKSWECLIQHPYGLQVVLSLVLKRLVASWSSSYGVPCQRKSAGRFTRDFPCSRRSGRGHRSVGLQF